MFLKVRMLQEHLDQFSEHPNTSTQPQQLRNYMPATSSTKQHLFNGKKRADMPVAEIDRLTIREWMASLHSDHKDIGGPQASPVFALFQFLTFAKAA